MVSSKVARGCGRNRSRGLWNFFVSSQGFYEQCVAVSARVPGKARTHTHTHKRHLYETLSAIGGRKCANIDNQVRLNLCGLKGFDCFLECVARPFLSRARARKTHVMYYFWCAFSGPFEGPLISLVETFSTGRAAIGRVTARAACHSQERNSTCVAEIEGVKQQ